MQLDAKQLAALRGFAADLLAFAASSDPGDVSAGMDRYGITDTQIMHLTSDLGCPATPEASDSDRLRGLYEDLTHSALPSNPIDKRGALQRLGRAIDSIPGWDAYAALTLDRMGSLPMDPRPGRPDDRMGPLPDSPARVAALQAEAMDHLRDRTRINYVVSGITDLDCETKDERDELDAHGIFVSADLDRFSDTELIKAFLDDPDLLGRLCVLKHERASQARR